MSSAAGPVPSSSRHSYRPYPPCQGQYPGTAPVSYTHLDVYKRQQFHRVARKRRVADAHVGNLRKCRLKRGQKFGFQLSIQTVAGIALPNIAADVRVEQNRVANAVAVFAEAANGDINVNAGPDVYKRQEVGLEAWSASVS